MLLLSKTYSFQCQNWSACLLNVRFTLYNDFYRENETTNHAVTYECQRIKKKN